MCTNKDKVMLRVSFDRESIVQAGFLPAVDTIKAHYCKVLQHLTFEIKLKEIKINLKRLNFVVSQNVAKHIDFLINLK